MLSVILSVQAMPQSLHGDFIKIDSLPLLMPGWRVNLCGRW